jgi:phosphatidylglycerophosphatase A
VRRVERALLSALGLGFLPGPTGTWASAATAALLVAVHGSSPGPFAPAVLAALAAGVVVTLAFAGRTAEGGSSDPSWVVSDEVAGQALALALAGTIRSGSGWIATVLAFLLFRAFDIGKPGPVGAAERLRGGLGVLADDLLAGAFAGALVAAARALGALGSG